MEKKESQSNIKNTRSASDQEFKSISAQLTDLKNYLNNIIEEQGANKKITPDSAKETIMILKKYNANCSIDSIKEICGKAWLNINYLIHNNKTFGPEVDCSSQDYFKILKSVITEIDKELPYAKIIDRFVNSINKTPFINKKLKRALIKHAAEITAILARDIVLEDKSNADRESTFTGKDIIDFIKGKLERSFNEDRNRYR